VATVLAADAAVEDGRAIAAALLEVDAADVVYGAGAYRVAGTDRAVSLFAVAAAARRGHAAVPSRDPSPLRGDGVFDPPAGTYTNGCHIAEVEIDPATGETLICRYTAVDDFGRLVNPALVAGQVAGGVAQGIGQALHEGVRYDAASGQILTATLLDYALPRAGDLPGFTLRTVEIPCRTNPLGLKGVGESGAVAAPPAVVNALLDALAPLGVEAIDMPATPAAVWAAIAAARPPY
jgi:carbon-monoxide dehydrogenase large subunit